MVCGSGEAGALGAGLAVRVQSQFSPRQVLDAARRAESDGRNDYAIQFYMHVLAHQTSAIEAAEANEGLRRLEPGGLAQQRAGGQSLPAITTNGFDNAGQPQVDPGTGPIRKSQAQKSRPRPDRSRRSPPTGHSNSPPHQRKRYRLGRFVAGLLGATGFLMAIAGITSLGANAMLWLTKADVGLLPMLATNPLFAASVVGLACVMILLSQMAKATFDGVSVRSDNPREWDRH